MTFKDSKGRTVRLRELIDALRDNFVLSLSDAETARLPETLSSFDHAVSETLLDLFDNPAPPSRQRALRSDAGKPRPRARTLQSTPMPEAQQPYVARPSRSKRRKAALPPVQLDSVEQDYADRMREPLPAQDTEQLPMATAAAKPAGAN